MYRTAGDGQTGGSLLFLQLQMLLPAFSAILLGRWVFKDCPFHANRYHQKPRLFFLVFIIFTLGYATLVAWWLLEPEAVTSINAVSGAWNMLGLILLLAVRFLSNGEEFAAIGLKGGKLRDWFLWGIAFVAFYALQAALNSLLIKGAVRVDLGEVITQIGLPSSFSPPSFLLWMAVQTIVLGSLLGVLMAFGEEFGWRGFLQDQLFRLGKRRGVILLGVIWGAWHWPVIWMGNNYAGQPLAGSFLMVGYTILLGIVLSHVMLKTGAIFLVAFLHAINNQALVFFNSFIVNAPDPVQSFGVGLWGLLTLLPVALILLLDPVWKDQPINLPAD